MDEESGKYLFGPDDLPAASKDGLISDTPGLEEIGYRLSRMILPDEIKARAEQIIQETRDDYDDLTSALKKIEKLSVLNRVCQAEKQALVSCIREKLLALQGREDSLNFHLQNFGGRTRQNVISIYENFKYDNYWFPEGFGKHDEEIIQNQLEHLASQKGVTLGQLKVIDIATGNGRVMRMMAQIIHRIDPTHYDEFISNLRGFDLVHSAVIKAKGDLRDLNIPDENIFEADFLSLPEEHLQGQYDLATAMMHTLWHVVTEEQWVRFLHNMEKAIRPGGRLLFDTVPVIRPHNVSDRETTFEDLHSFYTLIWRKYCDEKQREIEKMCVMFSGKKAPLLRHLPRFPIEDSTAGVPGKMFSREIITADYLDKTCAHYGIKFINRNSFNRVNAMGQLIALKLPSNDNQDAVSEKLNSQMQTEGEKWLYGNGLRDWLMNKIVVRLCRKTGRVITAEEAAALRPKDSALEGQAKEIYKGIAKAIFDDYVNQYYSYKRVA